MERPGADRVDLDDTVHDDTTAESSRTGTEWAVPEQYRVEDAGEPETAVVAARPPRARRFPLDRAGISLTAALLLLGSLALGAALLTSSPDAASESALDQPRPSDLGAVAPAPPKASTAPANRRTREVEVPDVKGFSVSEATRTLGKADLKVETRATESDRKAGTVIEQEPGAGDRVARASLVVLLVADGGQPVAEVVVPDVVGLRADRAAELARAKGLLVEVRSVRSSGEAGTVVGQKPVGGEPAARGSAVELSVAKSARPAVTTVRVPRVTGLPLAQAKARLSAGGLRWSVEQVPSSRPPGTVLSQLDRPGAMVEKGTRVTLEVSSGPQLTDVPDVVGLDVVLARQQLEGTGFVVIVTDSPTADPAEDGMVLDQSPGGGTRLREGAEVTISVGLAS